MKKNNRRIIFFSIVIALVLVVSVGFVVSQADSQEPANYDQGSTSGKTVRSDKSSETSTTTTNSQSNSTVKAASESSSTTEVSINEGTISPTEVTSDSNTDYDGQPHKYVREDVEKIAPPKEEAPAE